MSKIETIRKKILGPQELMIQLDAWRKQDLKIVFTNGCFDILHLGHADYLARAAALGDILVVGLNADTSITRLKGPGRPICDQSSRSFLLASLAVVDGVVLFDEDTPEKLIESVKPDFLVKGGDYNPAEIVGSKFVESYGGSVVCISLVKGYSTSSIEARIRHNQTK